MGLIGEVIRLDNNESPLLAHQPSIVAPYHGQGPAGHPKSKSKVKNAVIAKLEEYFREKSECRLNKRI